MAEPLAKLYYLFDRDHGPRHRLLPRWLFLRALGLIYLSAFLALRFQILGMNGSDGILPAAGFLAALRQLGNQRLWLAPTLLWSSSSDHALLALTYAGLVAAILATLNLAPKPALLVCFACFLSWVAVAQDFGQYQSDGMLLAAGLLAPFVAPSGLRPGFGADSLPSRAAYLLLLWEWFRIYFESGIVKLTSGDPTWRHLTALVDYYQDGPLPTGFAWYLAHLPFAFHRFTAALTLVMELALVFLAFLPRPWRIACFVLVTAWQLGVIATANYAFLNYLVLSLGFLLLDDQALTRFLPRLLSSQPELTSVSVAERPAVATARAEGTSQPSPRRPRRHPRELVRALRIAVTAVLLTTIAYATSLLLLDLVFPSNPLPTSPITLLEPFRIANQYGLFATMTPHRYEVEFQGSNDLQTWSPYLFRFKPQDPHTRPGFYAPYQPRFDWNLWFASLTSWDQAPIVPRTEIRLLQGSAQTLSLFYADPFPAHPPRYIRAVLYQYWFATPAQHRTDHLWWTRQLLGTYAPTLTLAPDGKATVLSVPSLNGPAQ